MGALCATLDHYQRAHPGTGTEELLEVLNEVYGVVSTTMERAGKRMP